MRRILFVFTALLLLTWIGLPASPVKFGERPFIDIYKVPDSAIEKGHIRIKLSEKLSSQVQAYRYEEGSLKSFEIEELDALNLEYGITKITPLFGDSSKNLKWGWRHIEWGLHLWFELEYDSSADIRDIVMAYRGLDQSVQWAEPEYRKQLLSLTQDQIAAMEASLSRWTPNDPRYGEQWHYHNTGQTGGTVDADIDLPEAWDIEKGHSDVVVCIQDQGVQYDHPDLAANMWINPGEIAGNGIDDDNNGYVDDVYGYNFYQNTSNIVAGDHGCHVAGTVAAVTNNGVGVSGIAGGSGTGNGVRLMSTQVFGPTSGGDGFEQAPIYAADNGACISQNSWGYTNVGNYDQVVLDAIDYFNANGGGTVMSNGITIYAAGNDESSGQWYPGCYSGVFAVAATTHNDTKAWYSNYDTWVDVSAPGGETDSVTSQGVLSCWSNSNYGFYQGTSMACPHASGVAALVISYAHRNGRTLSSANVEDILESTADDHYAVNQSYLGQLGSGRINAYQALLATDPTMPSVSITAPANGSIHDLNSSITIAATASDTDGYITGVAFYIDDVLKSTDTSSPYSWVWNTVGYAGGPHSIKVIATDNSGNTATRSITVTLLAPPDEGFETGNFTLYPWVNNSSVPWTVQSSEVFTGTYAAKSGAIGNNSSTTLSLPVVISSAGNLSFWYKVSSESNYDFLRFYIDGVKQGEWSGSAGWAEASYPVTSGSHTFAWTYSKDVSWANGSDCAWLDHIIFPPMDTYYAPPQNLTAVPGNGYVTLNWQAPVSGTPTGYRIYRDGNLLTTVTGLTYTDNAVVNETTYSYYLVAVYSGGVSDPTDTVQATPSAIVPTEVIIGTGTGSNGTNRACPINVWYQSLHGQSVYTAAELNAAGVVGPINITQIGFNVTGLPARVMPNFVVRMGHTSATDVSSWISTGLTQVWSSSSYQPTSTGWNMYTLSTPFLWNGIDNIVVDTAFGLIGGYNSSGTTQYTSVSNGYRYTRSDNSDQTNVFSGNDKSTYRPNLKLTLQPNQSGPMILVNPTTLAYGDVAVGSTDTKTFTIQNSGDQTLTGTITTPTGYNVAAARNSTEAPLAGKESRNSLSFSINAGATKTYNLTFAPTAATSYNGNVVIANNSTNNTSVNIAVTGAGYNPPTIDIDNDALYAYLQVGAEGTDSFTITNTGSQPLTFSISMTELASRAGNLLQAASAQEKSIEGSTVTLDASSYLPGTTVDWTFTATNASTDTEWMEDVIISFPAGVTVNSATNFVGGSGGDMTPDVTSGNGVTITWHGETSYGYGVIQGGQSASATVNVTIGSSFGGNLTLPWTLNGDIYGSEPHTLSGSNVLTQDSPPIPWLSVQPLSGNIAAGQSLTITANFSAVGMAVGTYEAMLTIHSNDPVRPTLDVSATMDVWDVSLAPEIVVSPLALDFGGVEVGTTSVLQFTVQNTGNAQLTGTISTPSGYSVAQAGTKGFVVDAQRPASLALKQAPGARSAQTEVRNTLTLSVPAGETITYNLTFAPTAVQSYPGNVVISSNDEDEPTVNIALTGSGYIPPTVSLDATALEATLAVNAVGTDSFNIANLGSQNLSFTLVEDPAVAWFSANPTSGTVAGNGSQPVTGSFTAAGLAPGTYTANLLVNSNDTDNPQLTVSLTLEVLNALPVIELPETLSFDMNSSLVEDFSDFVSDPDGHDLTLGYSGNTNILVSIEGFTVTFSATEDWYGSEEITFSVFDGYDYAHDTVTVTVNFVNHAPTLTLPASFEFPMNETLLVDFTPFIEDLDGHTVTLTVGESNHIQATINGYQVTFSAPQDWFGTETLNFMVDDGFAVGNASVPVTVLLTHLVAPQVTVQKSASGVIVSWETVTNANQYRVYRSTDPYGTYVLLGTTSTLSFEDTEQLPMAFYYVIAVYEQPVK